MDPFSYCIDIPNLIPQDLAGTGVRASEISMLASIFCVRPAR